MTVAHGWVSGGVSIYFYLSKRRHCSSSRWLTDVRLKAFKFLDQVDCGLVDFWADASSRDTAGGEGQQQVKVKHCG